MGFLYSTADVRPSVPVVREQWKAETGVRLPTWLRLGVKKQEPAFWVKRKNIKRQKRRAQSTKEQKMLCICMKNRRNEKIRHMRKRLKPLSEKR